MKSLTFQALSTLLLCTSFVAAQTSTSCDPTKQTCPDDVGLSSTSYSADFTKGSDVSFIAAAGTTMSYGSQGAEFTIKSEGQAPTLYSSFYVQFGYFEVKLKAAKGTGIVSSIVLLSDDLDEIDFEWIGGDNTKVETNYFGKGNTTTYDRANYYDVSTPSDTFHTYAVNWTSSSTQWLIDGTVVRTLNFADAVGGKNYPQTPCRLSLGIWSGGSSSSPGTVQWAGGKTDFSKAPFTMYVESVKITNYNPAVSYKYTDMSGSYQSIQAIDTPVSTNSSTSGSNTGSNITVAGSGTNNAKTTSSSSSSSTTSTSSRSTSSSSSSSTTSSTSMSTLATTSSTSSAAGTANTSGIAPGKSSGHHGIDESWWVGPVVKVVGCLIGLAIL